MQFKFDIFWEGAKLQRSQRVRVVAKRVLRAWHGVSVNSNRHRAMAVYVHWLNSWKVPLMLWRWKRFNAQYVTAVMHCLQHCLRLVFEEWLVAVRCDRIVREWFS
jgi:hypothetical protein